MLPFLSCLSRLSSLPSAELALGDPAPNTSFTSVTSWLYVAHVAVVLLNGRPVGGIGLVGAPSRPEGSLHERKRTAAADSAIRGAMRRRMRALRCVPGS